MSGETVTLFTLDLCTQKCTGIITGFIQMAFDNGNTLTYCAASFYRNFSE
jgi:hypothetical protein